MNRLIDFKDYMADLVYEYVSGVRRVGSNRLNFRCPICGDGKKSTSHRGWFYLDSGSYFCWNAGCPANEHGMSGIKFLSLVSGKDIADIKAELIAKAGEFEPGIEKFEVKSLSSFFNDDIKHERKTTIFTEKCDDGEWTEDLPKYALRYVEDRKLDRATFRPSWFKFYFDNKLKRIVIPWSDEYYQERTILKSQKDEDKYKFPFGIEKPIFGLDTLDENFKYIFICEGVFDSIWVKNGIAAGSLRLSKHQLDILDEYRKSYTIVYMPDNQHSDEASYNKTIDLTKKHPYEKIFIWPYKLRHFKDVNETIIYSDKFIDVWKNEKFLTGNVASGIMAQLKLKED